MSEKIKLDIKVKHNNPIRLKLDLKPLPKIYWRGIIYKLIGNSEVLYVGSTTKCLSYRLRAHNCHLKTHTSTFYRKCREMNIDQFTIEAIQIEYDITKDDLLDLERIIINEYRQNGYPIMNINSPIDVIPSSILKNQKKKKT